MTAACIGVRSASLAAIPMVIETKKYPRATGIPSFIPLNQDMDAFEMDKEAKTVVIKYNMNRIIVQNKSSEYVAPFFN